jgi:MFS family permease
MKLHRLALWTGIGSGLEYYAFITFALQAKVISTLFFGATDTALIDTFLVFAVGSLMSLLGGFWLGWLGDRFGRKRLLLWSISLMTLSTVGIGVLPTGLPFGLSIGLLVLCRLVQGASIGGEIPGAIVFVYEHAPAEKIGRLLGILFLGIGLGAGVSTGVNALVSHYFSAAQMIAFAWRIPFIMALVLGGAGYILRRKTTESPLFQAYLEAQHVKQVMLKDMRLPLLQGSGLVFFPAVLVSVGLYLPSYWLDRCLSSNAPVFLAMMAGFLITALFMPFLGQLGDKIGRKKLYFFGVALTLASLPLLMEFLSRPSPWVLYGFNLSYYFLIVIMAACYPGLLAALFPVEKRYQCVALSYAGTYAIAGVSPFVVSVLMAHWPHPLTLLLFLFAAGAVSFSVAMRDVL